jgi:hypothetical protein
MQSLQNAVQKLLDTASRSRQTLTPERTGSPRRFFGRVASQRIDASLRDSVKSGFSLATEKKSCEIEAIGRDGASRDDSVRAGACCRGPPA